MPVTKRKIGRNKYRVETPSGVKSKGTTKEKAIAQEHLLNGLEHGWKPTGLMGAKRA